MKISHAWLQEYFKDTLPSAEALAELFTLHSFEVEGVQDATKLTTHLADKILEVKVLPDRAHFSLSYRGIAEEVGILTGLARIEKAPDADLPAADSSLEKVEVEIVDENFCRRYVSRRVSNVEVKESPEKVKQQLAAMDGRSINTVVDSTNLAMFDYGQPLHAFDADKVKGQIMVRAAKEGETITLLDGKEASLTSSDFVVADEEGPLAIAGVKGGKRAEVNMETKNIIIESANFHPVSVRKTATKYNLRNESSKRFENEITPELAMDGMNHVSALINKLSPGAMFGPISDNYPASVAKKVLTVTVEFINEKLGIEIPSEKIIEILKSLSMEIMQKGSELDLVIPYHRLDLIIPEDIVEEVGRIYGYDKIEGTKQVPLDAEVPAHPSFYVTEHMRNILVDQGFSEVYLYTLVNKGDIEVAYPLASDKKALRTNLSEGMLKALEMNARNADLLFLDSIKMFEIGKVFTSKGENTALCVAIKRIKKVKGQTANEDIRQLREKLLSTLGVDIQTLCTTDDTGGLLMLKGKQLGIINNIDGIMEINLDMLIPHVSVPTHEALGFKPAIKTEFKNFSPYPFIVRDIAVFVPNTVQPAEIETLIATNGTDLLLKYNLFDTFQKEGKTSYAFRMIFQSYEKTLTDVEVSAIMATIEGKMKEKGWEVR
jgi:phenylalanyl-tRNA synthetase beta chain